MPWATDLLPHEIEDNMNLVRKGQVPKESKTAVFVGSRSGGVHGNDTELRKFQEGCSKVGIQFTCHTSTSINNAAAQKLIQDCQVAPTIVGTWQKDKGYIPCRIFKTISYGHFGLTNSFEASDCVNQMAV